VGLNVISGGLIQLVIWKAVGAKSISEKIHPKSQRIFATLFAPCLTIIGPCASNTPQHEFRYTKQIP